MTGTIWNDGMFQYQGIRRTGPALVSTQGQEYYQLPFGTTIDIDWTGKVMLRRDLFHPGLRSDGTYSYPGQNIEL